MTRIPTPALVLGLAGLIPFVWGAATSLSGGLAELSIASLGARFTAQALLQNYGIVILAFMSGVIWGFAARATGSEARFGYALSVVPALWAFFLGTGPLPFALWMLLVGFLSLLALDRFFATRGLAPSWWMSLRLLLTGVVSLCLMIGAIA